LTKKISLLVLSSLLFALGASAEAQQPKKIWRIGYLAALDPTSDSARSEAIRLALRELGYIEGQNIAIEYRYAQGKVDRAAELVADLVRLKVDIIVVAGGARWIRAAKNGTKTIPIVMVGPEPILSRKVWLKALAVLAVTSPVLLSLTEN
jgi:putative ABC transport system substrate-binding protein